MKRLHLTTFILFTGLSLFSQSPGYSIIELPIGLQGKKTVFRDGNYTQLYGDTNVDIKGSPYLDNQFLPGTIILKNGQRTSNIKIR